MNRRSRITLGILLALIAVNALPVGALMVAEPDGSALGIPLDVLERGPFTDFRVPGVFLFALGMGHLVALGAVLRARPRAWVLPALAGLATCLWIAVQVTMVRLSWLQPAVFIVGAVEFALALVWRGRANDSAQT